MKNMVKTIVVDGFPKTSSAISIKNRLENRKWDIVAVRVQENNVAWVQYRKSKNIEDLLLAFSKRYITIVVDRGVSTWLQAQQLQCDIIVGGSKFDEYFPAAITFGCRVGENALHPLHRIQQPFVQISTKFKQILIIIEYGSSVYKLKLSFRNIRELVCSENETGKDVLIQVFGSPLIYEKAKGGFNDYDRDPGEKRWFRTTDFTGSKSVMGESSHMCLHFPCDFDLNKFSSQLGSEIQKDFVWNVDDISSFGTRLDFSPIIEPTFPLPYSIIYKVCQLMQQGKIPGPMIDDEFFRLCQPIPGVREIDFILSVLGQLDSEDRCYNPKDRIQQAYDENEPKIPQVPLDPNVALVRGVHITPSKIYFMEPQLTRSNRVLRAHPGHHENFLRVSFVDEDLKKLDPTSLITEGGVKTKIHQRIKSTLSHGVQIGNKDFKFLAYSSSQLRGDSVWMFSSYGEVDAAGIRDVLGDFTNIKNVGKYGARLGQSFAASKKSFHVKNEEVEKIPDITITTGSAEYIFSDGIGKISPGFAEQVAKICGYEEVPSAFQIRYGGYKGVVAVNKSSSAKLSLRPSMCKYESQMTELDILEVSRYFPLHINNQLTILLSTLGVKDEVFIRKQDEVFSLLRESLENPLKAKEASRSMSPGVGKTLIKEMLACGYEPKVEPFLSALLKVAYLDKVSEMVTKTRIYVPKGRSMMGCLDEEGILTYGQVFIRYSEVTSEGDKIYTTLEGDVLVTKSPCLHPGDVRTLRAIDVPDLNHMMDCIVFPQKGPRPHTNECSGSDLDGDLYMVCWDTDLIPPKQIQPMDYSSAPTTSVEHAITIEDVTEYVAQTVADRIVQIISSNHLVFADQQKDKAGSQQCLELAKLFAQAIDSPKTGINVDIPPHLDVKRYPDFMGRPVHLSCISKSVLGTLYRNALKEKEEVKLFTQELAMQFYDADMEVEGFKVYLKEAVANKKKYDQQLRRLMDMYQIKSEARMFCGNDESMSNSWNDVETIGVAVENLMRQARELIIMQTGEPGADVKAKVSASYYVTYHKDYYNDNSDHKDGPLMSFPWSVYETLVQIKTRKNK